MNTKNTQGEEQHTLTGLVIQDSFIRVNDGKGLPVLDERGAPAFYCLLGDWSGKKEARANAKRIIHCVNHFDEVVETIQAALRIKDLWLPPDDHHADEDAEEIKTLMLMKSTFEQVIKKVTE